MNKQASIRTHDGRFWSVCDVYIHGCTAMISWSVALWSHRGEFGGTGQFLGSKTLSESIDTKDIASIQYLG